MIDRKTKNAEIFRDTDQRYSSDITPSARWKIMKHSARRADYDNSQGKT